MPGMFVSYLIVTSPLHSSIFIVGLFILFVQFSHEHGLVFLGDVIDVLYLLYSMPTNLILGILLFCYLVLDLHLTSLIFNSFVF